METPRCWQVLQLERQDIPRLLVKYNFHKAGYQVYLTDLSRIWEESLTKGECIEHAVKCGSSIDPSQDDEQLQILLDKIQSAFEHHDDTTLDLTPKAPDGSVLSIELSATLPKPLAPLKWTLQLQLRDPSQLADHLVSPIMNQAISLQHQVEHLISELQNKNRVISKICDRLETSGNDLTTVFPGVSNIKTSRKRAQRDQLAVHVKGLGDFDEDAWRFRSNTTAITTPVSDAELNGILGRLHCPDEATTEGSTKAWWNHLDPHGTLPTRKALKSTNESRGSPVVDRVDSQVNDEFQKQSTPPHLKRRIDEGRAEDEPLESAVVEAAQTGGGKQEMPNEDSSTEEEDDDDLDAIPKFKSASSQKPKPGYATSQSPAQQIMAVHEQAQRQHHPIPSPAPRKKLGAIGGRSLKSPSPSPFTEELSTTVKSGGGLGKFGGKPKPSSPAIVDEVALEIEPRESLPTRSQGLGKLGGKKARNNGESSNCDDKSPPAAHGTPPRSRPVEMQPTPPPRETSQERADKKRDQLKRELDEKSKAPVKKKRKF